MGLFMNQNELTEMVSSGLSIAQISEKTNKSKSDFETKQKWLSIAEPFIAELKELEY